MKIQAHALNRNGTHEITLQTNENVHSIAIPPKASGFGSSVNGGELLFLALATRYCNNIYREAAKRNIVVEQACNPFVTPPNKVNCAKWHKAVF